MTITFKEAHTDFFEPLYKDGIDNTRARLKKYALHLKADAMGFRSLSGGNKKRLEELTTDAGGGEILLE
jgi:hypothetical protein